MKRTSGCVAQHGYCVVEKGIGENLSNDLEEVTVPGYSFLRKKASGKGTSKFSSVRLEDSSES